MSKEKQIDIIRDLLTEFDEMGFVPFTTVPNPEAYAVKWREEITKALEDYIKQSEGEWVKVKSKFCDLITHQKCSNCGWTETLTDNHKFCPNCGAKMKGGAE